jgi:PAS domain S-box-containing protein
MKEFEIPYLKLPTPARALCVLLLVIFGLETLIMYALEYFFPSVSSPNLQNLLDATLLSVLCSPVLYRYLFKPFRDTAVLQKSLSENVLAHVVDGVLILDDSLQIQVFNAAAERIFGYQAAELVGGHAGRILDDGCLQAMSGEKAGFAETDGIRACTGRRSDGTDVPLEFSLSRVNRGGSWMWLGILRDVSLRKRDDDQLKQTLSLLTATLESTADGIMVRDLTGKTLIFNKRFGEMWRVPEHVMATHEDEVTRAYVLDQLKDPDGFLKLTSNQYSVPEGKSFDLVSFKDGRIYERFSGPQVMDDKIVGRVICYRDITEQKNLEHQLRHAQKMEALGTLAGGVAHDFNNILTVIMGFCDLTAAELDKSSTQKHYMDQIMAASERALTLTNSLLAYSRKQVMNPSRLELNARLQQTEKFLARLIGEDIELVTKLCQEKLVVMADSGQLEQVLMNLAANARDAMSRKGSLVIATAKLEINEGFVRLHGYGKPGTFALLSVSDTGSGIDAATKEKIFEPFFTTKQMGQGTGLGLSIVYGIVKQHDGYINVYSEPGKGTTFNIFLPLIEGAEDAPGPEQQQVAGGNETILLAEDDHGVRALVKIILTGSGYTVIEAGDGEEALAKFRQNEAVIGLLVLDVVMPKKNGKELYEEICTLKNGVKAIFISGYTADIMDKNGLMQSGLHLLTKPLLPSQLLAKVREVLDQ